MQLGLFGINSFVCASDPTAAVRVAVAAEGAGWESLWTGEHYVLPDPATPAAPSAPDTPMLDPFVALAQVAARTRTIRLGTGLTVVPVHHPVMLAKKVASIDRVSGGRFLFGVGAGYLEPELDALDVPLAERGARLDEHLDAMRALWAGDTAGHHGRHSSFAGVRAEPGPLQLPSPPLHVGGHSPSALRRAVTRGHGWYGWMLDLTGAEKTVAALRRAQDEHPRPAKLGPLEISVTPHPRLPLDDETVSAFAELGVTRLIVLPPSLARGGADDVVRDVEEIGARLG